MPRETVVRWACEKCNTLYSSEKSAQTCEDSHPDSVEDIEAVVCDGYQRAGSAPKFMTVSFTSGKKVDYKRVGRDV